MFMTFGPSGNVHDTQDTFFSATAPADLGQDPMDSKGRAPWDPTPKEGLPEGKVPKKY